jgi:predicted ester cyclase
MSGENKSVVQRFFQELWNTGSVDAIDDLMDANCDGDFSVPGTFPSSAEEAFSLAKSPSYAESGVTRRLKDMTKTHPDLAKLIIKGLILRQEGNFRGIIKSRAKKYREVIPDVQCTIEEMVDQDDMVWTRWTLQGTFRGDRAGAANALIGKSVTVTGVSICRLTNGKIVDYRSQTVFTNRWFESIAGVVPRP